MKNILHRCIAILLAMVLTFNFSLFERRVLANPIVIPIAESVLLPLLGGALIGAGMTFSTDADYSSALKFAMKDPTLYAIATASVVYKTVIKDHLTGATEKIAQGLEFTKQTFLNMQNAIKARFSKSAQVDTTSTNTVSLGSVEHPVSYYGGLPIMVTPESSWLSVHSSSVNYVGDISSLLSKVNRLKPYLLGATYTEPMTGWKFTTQAVEDMSYPYTDTRAGDWKVWSVNSKLGINTNFSVNRGVWGSQSFSTYYSTPSVNTALLCYLQQPDGLYMAVAYYGYGQIYSTYYTWFHIAPFLNLNTANIPESQLETYGFNAALSPVNVFTDTPEYEAIINDIARLKGSAITEEDRIVVSPVVAPQNQQRQDVIAVNPEAVIPDIENPPDIPVLPDNSSIFDWLNSFWVKLGAMLTSLMTHITTSTSASIDSNTETLADAIGNIISANTTRVITETKAADVTFADTIVGTGTINLNAFKANGAKLLTVFPFCIPFDFVNAINSLATSPKVPYYSIDFTGTVLGNYKWELDMTQFEPIAKVVRWTVWISFAVGLMLMTRKFIKW